MPVDRQKMVPGVDYFMSLQDENRVSRGKNLQANLKHYQLYQALLQGGTAILWPPNGTEHPISGGPLDGGSYLTRLPGESRYKVTNSTVRDPFAERVNQSSHVPIAEQIVDIYVNTLFRQEIDRQAVEKVIGVEFMNDVDLKGHNAEDFLAMVYTLGLANGWVGVLTDTPPLDPGVVPSRAHELASGRRPYSRILLPTRIWDWELDPVTNEFTWALVHETIDTWRVWTMEAWFLIDEDLNVLQQGLHSHGKVPIDLFIAKEPTSEMAYPPPGISAINSSALMQLQVDQHQSLGDELQRKTNYPFVHVQADTDAIADVPTGDAIKNAPGNWQFYDAEVDWKAPPDTCLEQNRRHIADLESKIYKAQGVHRRSQDSVEAHSGLALDYENSPIYATVQAWARRLRTFENRYWQTVGQQMGVDVEPNIVDYPEDFSVRPVDHEIGQAKDIVDVYGGWANVPDPVKKYVDLKIATAMKRDKGHVKAVKKYLADIEKIDYAEAAPEPKPEETEPPQEEEPDGDEME
jgi:hypothetical protein